MANYYRRYIQNFARIAKPLTSLCKKDQPFVWTNHSQDAFNKLKKILAEDIILAFPDFESVFYVTTDASDIALGAVLSQGELPNDRPIHFYSKTLSETQKHYSTIQKELLAITEAIKAFRPYLYGRFFILITDHKPLCYLFNMKDCGSRLFRQRLEILDYNFKILHYYYYYLFSLCRRFIIYRNSTYIDYIEFHKISVFLILFLKISLLAELEYTL